MPAELALAFLRCAKSHNIKNGQLTSEVAGLRAALRPLIARTPGSRPPNIYHGCTAARETLPVRLAG
jgi:hypothetical protein